MSTALALASAALSQAPTSAAPAPATVAPTVDVVGAETFGINQFFTVTYRFEPRSITVPQGTTVTWNNQTIDGHTVSVVTPENLPRTLQQINNCAICNQISAAHFPNGFPPAGAPVLVLDDLKPANPPAKFDSPGDSMLIAPPGLGLPTSSSAEITAPAGTTLNYMCAFHPWMQGSIHVIGSAT